MVANGGRVWRERCKRNKKRFSKLAKLPCLTEEIVYEEWRLHPQIFSYSNLILKLENWILGLQSCAIVLFPVFFYTCQLYIVFNSRQMHFARLGALNAQRANLYLFSLLLITSSHAYNDLCANIFLLNPTFSVHFSWAYILHSSAKYESFLFHTLNYPGTKPFLRRSIKTVFVTLHFPLFHSLVSYHSIFLTFPWIKRLTLQFFFMPQFLPSTTTVTSL